MKLTVLGSGSYISGPERAASGFALELNKEAIIIDLGFGCLKNLQKSGIDYSKVNSLFFTHDHIDHINDLSAFLFARKGLADAGYSEKTQVNLFGGPGFKEFMANLWKTYPALQNIPFKINISELEAFGTKKFNDFSLTTKPMKHRPSSIGLRIEANGKSVLFTGDTEENENLVELAKNADLVVIDCNYATKKAEGHLNAVQIGKIVSKANAKAVLLTHFDPETEKEDLEALVSKNFKGVVYVAKDLMQVNV